MSCILDFFYTFKPELDYSCSAVTIQQSNSHQLVKFVAKKPSHKLHEFAQIIFFTKK